MKRETIDENLIIRMANGDKDAFKELYGLTSDAVYGFALSILRSREDAEDVMHDAFIKIYTGAGSYIPAGKPLAWILQIVRNLAYNKIRDEKKTAPMSAISRIDDGREPEKEIAEDSQVAAVSQETAGSRAAAGNQRLLINPESNDIEQATDRIVLEAALSILDSDELEIVALHALAGYKHKEIAEFLKKPQGTVISKYNRALKKMRMELEGKEEAE